MAGKCESTTNYTMEIIGYLYMVLVSESGAAFKNKYRDLSSATSSVDSRENGGQ